MEHDAAYYPIIYVRGYAMTEGEINETTADPFCGFNIGSTVYRATPEKGRARKFIFESPVVRLASEYKYGDIYSDGMDIADPEWTAPIPRRSIIIFRYYEAASSLLGESKMPPIEDFARELGRLILKVQERAAAHPDEPIPAHEFKCYLVAHSMGGLVCRALLQNRALDPGNAAQYVDKFFTFATPHNGIDVAGMNVPSWLSANDISNFSRERMQEYLDLGELYRKTQRVDWLPPGTISPERVFCLIGTNRNDYEAALGTSRTFVGSGSDGLVRIDNAWACGIEADMQTPRPTAKAFVYRSHSGYFGIVNSEESYQNLTRFLFGDVRVDIWLDLEEITLPAALQRLRDEGKRINALYQIELLASPRGKPWFLTRRVGEEDSVACLTQAQWDQGEMRHLYLSTVFLAKRAKVTQDDALAYSVTLGVRVPDYEVDRRLWLDEHYEGGYLFRDSTIIQLFPPSVEREDWAVRQGWQSTSPGSAPNTLPIDHRDDGKMEVLLPIASNTTPGVRGTLRFVASPWR
ncbi:MAG: esterase/lipase family protein [Burkholderiales bacterium]